MEYEPDADMIFNYLMVSALAAATDFVEKEGLKPTGGEWSDLVNQLSAHTSLAIVTVHSNYHDESSLLVCELIHLRVYSLLSAAFHLCSTLAFNGKKNLIIGRSDIPTVSVGCM